MNRANGLGSAAGPRPMNGQARPAIDTAESNTSRAQRFESEKQRIQESCFAKVDEHGQQAESYITHLRIEEDGAYPSMPPPPEAAPENKKARIIIVAVRSTGRVRVHKARENHNGSFSIGKTWNLEDLSAIESFNHVAPDADQQRRTNCQRAGSLGFTAVISKPYYWQANTSKERDFFIASLVKIYRKYTKGRMPLLIGFSDQEYEQMFGMAQQAQQPRPSNAGTVPHPPFDQQSRPPSRGTDRNRSISRGQLTPTTTIDTADSPRMLKQQPSYGSFADRADPIRPSGQSAQSLYDRNRPFDQGLGIRGDQAQERLRRPSKDVLRPAANGRTSPPGSRSQSRGPRAQSPAPSQASMSSKLTATSNKPYGTTPVLQRGLSDDGGQSSESKDRWAPVSSKTTPDLNIQRRRPFETNNSPSKIGNGDHSQPDNIPASQKELPERRRPPIAPKDLEKAASYENPNLKPPPLSTSRSPSVTTSLGHKSQGLLSAAPAESVSSSPAVSIAREKSPIRKAVGSPPLRQEPIVSPASDTTAEPATPATPAGPATPDADAEGDSPARPGLGPMFKKREVANQFRKAAIAATAFKPRAGGAGERLKQKTELSGENDGVHGVAPAPLRSLNLEASRNNSVVSATESDKAESPQVPSKGPSNILETIKGTFKSVSPKPGPQQPPPIITGAADGLGITSEVKQDTRPVAKPKRRSPQQERYIASLGIDPALFENKGLDFEAILTEFGWDDETLQPSKLEYLENDIKREIGRVETGSWLHHMAQKDDRVGMVDKMLDRAIAECDELDGLLTLYSVELSTLNEDIAYIEAQSQGLQVQTANQKILHAELQKLVQTISITPEQLAALAHGSFDNELEKIEANLCLLYGALLTIDPTVKVSSTSSQTRALDKSDTSELANMHALQEKRDEYLVESDRFCQRLLSRMGTAFDVSLKQAVPMLLKPSASGRSAPWSLHPQACNSTRSSLWQYGPLILYTKEVNQPAWRNLLNTYTDIARPLFQNVFQTAIDSHRKNIRVPTGEEADVLFTTAEKESADGVLGTRKLNMKRSQTLLGKSARQVNHDKARMLSAGRQQPYEMFADMLQEWAPALSMEQNFFTELFHATSLDNLDFYDVVQVSPEQRRGPADLIMPRSAETDRNVADHIQRAMSTIFEFWPTELIKLIDQSLAADPIQAVGMLASLAVFSAPLHETSQEFLLRSLDDATAKLEISFQRFIDAQVRAIEDTKVLSKKRKGIVGFVRTFPGFALAIETVFTGAARSAGNNPAIGHVRQVVEDAYERINQAMWVSLRQIAKDSPNSTAPGTSGQNTEAEDKEILNYHILLIENMTLYIEEVEDGGEAHSTLAKWRGRAQAERAEHLDSYVKRVVRRPLGKLLDFIESTEALVTTHSANPAAVASKPSHSRSAARRVLAAHDAAAVRKGIDALRKRVDKHFVEQGAADLVATPSLEDERVSVAQALVDLVLRGCEAEYLAVLDRTVRLCAEVYSGGDKAVEVEWAREDVVAGFRR